MKFNFAKPLLFALALGFVRLNAEAEENKDEARFLSNVQDNLFSRAAQRRGLFFAGRQGAHLSKRTRTRQSVLSNLHA